MFAKGQKKGTIKFSLKPGQGVRTVMLAGTFNQWEAVAMKKQKDGSFALTLPLVRGTNEYKFIVDGQWIVDPDNNNWAMNPYGTLNSVVVVS